MSDARYTIVNPSSLFLERYGAGRYEKIEVVRQAVQLTVFCQEMTFSATRFPHIDQNMFLWEHKIFVWVILQTTLLIELDFQFPASRFWHIHENRMLRVNTPILDILLFCRFCYVVSLLLIEPDWWARRRMKLQYRMHVTIGCWWMVWYTYYFTKFRIGVNWSFSWCKFSDIGNGLSIVFG